MISLIAAAVYALHAISLPSGWSLVTPTSGFDVSTEPTSEAIARNGAVAVLLTRTGNPGGAARRLLIVRANGTRLILQPRSLDIANAFPHSTKPSDCMADVDSCPYFERVTLAPDGTPFVTLTSDFSGAYSGSERRGFVWNGRWHPVPPGKAFSGVGKPDDPENVSISAADGGLIFAFVGDYQDRFPNEDLDLALQDRYYMAEVSGVSYEGVTVALGIGNATAMSGAFVAGFDGDLKLVPSRNHDLVAVAWRCAFNKLANARACARNTLGPGIAYGIDSYGEAVGDNESSVPDLGSLPLHSAGFPVLWRHGHTLMLSKDDRGAAYAISGSGVIAGTLTTGPGSDALLSGFVANAREKTPRAFPLDELVQNDRGRHVEAALGVADDGRILAFVTDRDGRSELAVLAPAPAVRKSR
ncbi:MAG TPA: hypothetical protein VGG51_10300 [Candidatus Cybelea sp.]|jgi:hypothetical protein